MKARMVRPYPDLKTWRNDSRLSQQEAASFLGISQQYYSRLERRVRATTGARAKVIMAKTGVPLEVLVDVA